MTHTPEAPAETPDAGAVTLETMAERLARAHRAEQVLTGRGAALAKPRYVDMVAYALTGLRSGPERDAAVATVMAALARSPAVASAGRERVVMDAAGDTFTRASDGWLADTLDAAVAPGVPAGYALVPLEPTAAMRWAGWRVPGKGFDTSREGDGGIAPEQPAIVYRAMLAAVLASSQADAVEPLPTKPWLPAPDTTADDADAGTVLASVRLYAQHWQGDARIIGNVRAKDIIRAVSEVERCLAVSAAPAGGVPGVEAIAEALWETAPIKGRCSYAEFVAANRRAPGEDFRALQEYAALIHARLTAAGTGATPSPATADGALRSGLEEALRLIGDGQVLPMRDGTTEVFNWGDDAIKELLQKRIATLATSSSDRGGTTDGEKWAALEEQWARMLCEEDGIGPDNARPEDGAPWWHSFRRTARACLGMAGYTPVPPATSEG